MLKPQMLSPVVTSSLLANQSTQAIKWVQHMQAVCQEDLWRQNDLTNSVAAWIRPQLRSAFASWAILTRAAAETRTLVASISSGWQNRFLFDALYDWKVRHNDLLLCQSIPVGDHSVQDRC